MRIWRLTALLLALLLAACGRDNEDTILLPEDGDEDYYAQAQDKDPPAYIPHAPEEDPDPDSQPPPDPPEILATFARDAHFTSRWAKNATYIFVAHSYLPALYRLPLGDISGGDRLALPGDGDVEFLGMSEQYLFVSQMTGPWDMRHYEIYRISKATLEAQRSPADITMAWGFSTRQPIPSSSSINITHS